MFSRIKYNKYEICIKILKFTIDFMSHAPGLKGAEEWFCIDCNRASDTYVEMTEEQAIILLISAGI
jgi:hypothetical protein